jgi:lactam utilization protein B
VMERTLAMAKQNNVMVGAHPAYPDLVGFGRRPRRHGQDPGPGARLCKASRRAV